MKYVWFVLRLLLPIATIVLVVFSTQHTGDAQSRLLGGGLLCLALSTCLNLYFQRKSRKEGEKDT